MSLVLDVIIIVLFVLTVIIGYKRGFFKSVMTLCSGVVALLAAYAFSPRLAELLDSKLFLPKIASGIADTLASIAKSGTDAVYDLTKLLDNPQLLNIISRYGANSEAVNDAISTTQGSGYDAVESVAKTISAPISHTLSNVCAFIIIFVAVLIVLRIVTALVGCVFKLPVLKTLDKVLGLVFGVVSALLFVWLFAYLCEAVLGSLATVAPDLVSPNTMENTILLRLFAGFNAFDLLGALKLNS